MATPFFFFFPSPMSIQFQSLSLSTTTTMMRRPSSRDMVVRMGGGPRTFPGGVSKWQWKRMQEKKAKQLLKARLLRERQVYEMRKRAELKVALTQLERPWEAVRNAPNLFSVGADEQVKTLADRFQKPGGFDMWNENDGPQVFKRPNEELPSVRFFPKGAVHSIKPYTRGGEEVSEQEQGGEPLRFDDWIAKGAGGIRKTRSWRENKAIDVECTQDVSQSVSKENYDARQRRNDSNGRYMIGSESTKEAPEYVSRNFGMKGGNPGMDKRKTFSNRQSLGSFREKRGDTEYRQGFRQNDLKTDMRRLKPVERERDVGVERKGRFSSKGNTDFRRVTSTTLRPSSHLSNEKRRIEK